jgi:hypothetical protein
MTNGKNEHHIFPLLIAIERYVAALAIRDQKFPQSLLA